MMGNKGLCVAGVIAGVALVALLTSNSLGNQPTVLMHHDVGQILQRNLHNPIGLHTLRAKAAFNALSTLQQEVDSLELQGQGNQKLHNSNSKYVAAFGRLRSLERLTGRMEKSGALRRNGWQSTKLVLPSRNSHHVNTHLSNRVSNQRYSQDGAVLPPDQTFGFASMHFKMPESRLKFALIAPILDGGVAAFGVRCQQGHTRRDAFFLSRIKSWQHKNWSD
eukprot:CAMPEP_0181292540 /NCGR_PEP_ID=MMETSP1101-20121128/2561_1 /TAXON_ID=46948 /ORGANISM="Rhodomonas abbreviata, Strain Caron Lab Isolate" /LENGTH=220 /DNA_ID=CAMNT_0023397017 /DNA_START=10 /DNA_END=670 /DNA_ORIENTATION=+